MEPPVRSVEWEGPAHHHIENGSDWFWALGIIAVFGAAAAFIFGNYLLAVVVLLGGGVMAGIASREPEIIHYAITPRGLRVDEKLYPYSTLDAFYIDEEDPRGPQLLARSTSALTHLVIMPLPEEHLDDIEEILTGRLPEEHLEEPLSTKLLESLGF